MLGLLAGVEKVELIGGEGWLEHNSVALAAIIAAIVAAAVAILNRRAQLRHDRAMRNREHIRDTIDEGVATVNDAAKAVATFQLKVQVTDDNWEQSQRVESDESTPLDARQRVQQELQNARNDLYLRSVEVDQMIGELFSIKMRMVTRLGEAHPVVASYDRFVLAVQEFYFSAAGAIHMLRPPDAREDDHLRLDQLRERFKEFRESCYQWFND
jgi:hypothetical protein